MDKREQLDALYAEIFKVLERFECEFDLDEPEVIRVLQCLIHDTLDVNLDCEVEWNENED